MAVARTHELSVMTFATGGGDAAWWARRGFDRVVVSSDIALLRAGLERELASARNADPATGS